MGPLVSIIILNYNGKKFLKPCFDSLDDQSYKNFEVVFVDNGSSDGSVEYVKELAPDTKIVVNDENAGFSEGNNQGIRAANGEYIVTLNNDTVVDKEWLTSLVTAAKEDDTVGMCCSKIFFMESPHLIDSFGLNICLDGNSRGRGRLEEDTGQYDDQRDVLIPNACAALYKRAMLDETGLFDGDFFAYCEDTDLALRGWLAGWKAVFVPDAKVSHFSSGTSGQYSPFKAYLVERNHLFVVFKSFPFSLLLLVPLFSIYRFALQFVSVLFKKGSAGELSGEVSTFDIIKIIFRAYFDAFKALPALRKKRRAIRKTKKMSTQEFYALISRHNLTLKELVFKK